MTIGRRRFPYVDAVEFDFFYPSLCGFCQFEKTHFVQGGHMMNKNTKISLLQFENNKLTFNLGKCQQITPCIFYSSQTPYMTPSTVFFSHIIIENEPDFPQKK
ncbi:unnamed protein product [Heterobilharzia americana]|nr:unnamed protein product [Heterobilharzia americana]